MTRLFQLYDERDRAYRAIRAGGRLGVGSQGQTALAPLVKYIAQLDSSIVVLEDRLGLSPRARLQLGLAVIDTQRGLDSLDIDLDETTEDPRARESPTGAADADEA